MKRGASPAIATLLVWLVISLAAAQPAPDVLVDAVKPYLGVSYLWGGTDPATGLDCSAFVRLVYKEFGVELPRTSREQYRAYPLVVDELLPGDLLFFSENGRTVTHVALYLGNGYMAHSSLSRGGVTIEPAQNLAPIFVGANRPWLRIARQTATSGGLRVYTQQH